jgi:lycopene beta-cyclase
MIRSQAFYAECKRILSQHKEFEWLQADIHSVTNTVDAHTLVCTDKGSFHAPYTFNSLFDRAQLQKKEDDISLLQHFKGWFIRTEKPVFDPNKAVFMDFRVPQTHGVTFVYVLPLSENTALVEFTLFNAFLLEPDAYDEALKQYITHYLKIGDYTIEEEEFGIIPMTDHVFPSVDGNIVYIGTAGGYTKSSSGYTFRNIQQRTTRLVAQMQKGIAPNRARTRSHWRFPKYDAILLYVLAKRKMEGKDAFRQLFEGAPPRRVLEFLDETTTFVEDIPILWSLPTWIFLKAGVRTVLGSLRGL